MNLTVENLVVGDPNGAFVTAPKADDRLAALRLSVRTTSTSARFGCRCCACSARRRSRKLRSRRAAAARSRYRCRKTGDRAGRCRSAVHRRPAPRFAQGQRAYRRPPGGGERGSACACRAEGIAGGDRVVVALDAVPEKNRLDLSLRPHCARRRARRLLHRARRAADRQGQRQGRLDQVGRALRRDHTAGDELADVALGARSGTLTMRGWIRPSNCCRARARPCSPPDTAIDLTAALAEPARRSRRHARQRQFPPWLPRAWSILVTIVSKTWQARFPAVARCRDRSQVSSARTWSRPSSLDGAFATPRIAYNLTAA